MYSYVCAYASVKREHREKASCCSNIRRALIGKYWFKKWWRSRGFYVSDTSKIIEFGDRLKRLVQWWLKNCND